MVVVLVMVVALSYLTSYIAVWSIFRWYNAWIGLIPGGVALLTNISWLPGQATGFHDHGGSAGAFAVVWGTLVERRVVGARTTGQVLAKPIGAGGARAFGPRYIHDVRNAAASSVAVSVHAYSPPLPAMTRYELAPGGLVMLSTEGAAAW